MARLLFTAALLLALAVACVCAHRIAPIATPEGWSSEMPDPLGAASSSDFSPSSNDAEMMPVRSPSAAALPRCDRTTVTEINGTTGQFGCLGASPNVRMTWVCSTDKARIIKWSISGYQDSTVTFFVDGVSVYGPFVPNAYSTYYFESGKELKIVYFAGSYNQGSYGLDFTVSPGPAVNALVSSQTTTITTTQQGGFVYFLLPYQSQGRYFQLDVEVFSYQGLQEPSVFVNRNSVPSLEHYDYTNTTVTTSSGRETCLINVVDPPSAAYMVGVFLYGTAASMSVKATWTFNMQWLVSGVRVSNTQCGTCFSYYQIYVPPTATKLVFQISRQLPGGYPIAWISQGSLPSALSYQWVADTRTQSYISITIPNPHPASSSGANPGLYLFTLGNAEAVTSGYIMQVDYA